MTRKTRRRSSPWRIVFLVCLIGLVLYVNKFVVPYTPAFAVPTSTPTRSPESFLNEGDKFFNQGKLIQAIDAYQKAIQADPNNRSIYVALARVQIYAGDYEQAKESGQRALIGNEEYAAAHAVLGWAFYNLKDYPQATIELKKSIELDPNNILAHSIYAMVLGDTKDEFGNMQKAIDESTKALALDANDMEALSSRGYILFLTGNNQESLKKYQAALAINKNLPDLYMMEGYNYRALNDYENEIQAFLQAAAYSPKDPVPEVELSRAYASVGEYAKAAQYAENAVKLDPENPRRYGNLGIMYYRNGEYNKAIEVLTLTVRGGTTTDGTVVKGIPLSNDLGVPDYYTFYGFALAKATPNRCDQSLPVFQLLVSAFPDDQSVAENQVAAQDICSEATGSKPAARPTPSPTPKKKS